MVTFNLIFRSVFFFFCIWTLVWVLGTFTEKKLIHQIDKGYTRVIIFLGIIHIVTLLLYCFDVGWDANGLQLDLKTTSQITGKYWFAFWIYPFTYFFLTQLLWFKKMRLSKIYRIALAVCILIVLNLHYLFINRIPAPGEEQGIYI